MPAIPPETAITHTILRGPPPRPRRRAAEAGGRHPALRPAPAEQAPRADPADRAEVELPLAADVEQVHPERGGGRKPGEEERRRERERAAEGAVRREGGL